MLLQFIHINTCFTALSMHDVRTYIYTLRSINRWISEVPLITYKMWYSSSTMPCFWFLRIRNKMTCNIFSLIYPFKLICIETREVMTIQKYIQLMPFFNVMGMKFVSIERNNIIIINNFTCMVIGLRITYALEKNCSILDYDRLFLCLLCLDD